MKVLLDECLPHDFRHCFPFHEVHTVQWAGLKSRKNGELLRRAEESGYDLLLTVDQGIAYQQRLTGKKIAILAIRSRSNRMQDLLPMVDAIDGAIAAIRPGELLRVGSANTIS